MEAVLSQVWKSEKNTRARSFFSFATNIEASMTKFFLYLCLEHSAGYLYARVIVPEENNRHIAQ